MYSELKARQIQIDISSCQFYITFDKDNMKAEKVIVHRKIRI